MSPVMAFRFVHAADIHLDSPLRSLALRDPELAELIGGATRRAFVAIIDLCLEEQVDALLIAGDLYDGDQTSMKTARFLSEQLRRLDQAGVKSFIIRGNHDAMSKITKELSFPDSVKIFGGRAEAVTLTKGGLDIAIHGLSFAQAHAPESLLAKYRAPLDGCVNIGLMHTSLGGAPGHDLYAPCSPADLMASGFDYWALGHIHARRVDQGRATIVMPGMPQGRDIGEDGAKSATLVTVGDDRELDLAERLTGVAEFARVAIDLTGVEGWEAALARVGEGLARAREKTRGDHLVARLRLTGATPLAWRLRYDADLLGLEAAESAKRLGRTWIDKIEMTCQAPRAGRETTFGDPIAELRTFMEGEIASSPAFVDGVRKAIEDLRAQLPAKLLDDVLGVDPEAFAAAMRAIAQEGCEDVIAHLRGDAREIER
jgi:DNA repair exonuclease SbcCD nuclease subunit